MPSSIVLILDGDVGFLLAFSQELSKRGILSCPARTVAGARSMIMRFRLAPDVLMIDCSIRKVCSFAEEIADECRKVKIIGIVSARSECDQCAEQLAAILRDPDDIAPDRIPHCADLVEHLLRRQLHHNGHTTAP